VTAAANAQTTANNAASSATIANSLLADIASDSKLTPVEKSSARSEWNIIAAELTANDAQATAFGITTEKTAYDNAFQALATYLNAGTTWTSGIPSWLADANLGTTTDIVGATFRATWKAYYDARTALLNAIAAKAKTLADAAQSAASGAAAAASAAQETANSAASSATTANNLIADISNDNKLTAVEKSSSRKEWDIIAAELSVNDTQATAFGITTEKTTYDNAFQALANYLNNGTTWVSGVPSWLADANLGTTTTIDGATYRSMWKTYYDSRTALLNKIAEVAKEAADSAQGTADSKTTLWATLAIAQSSAVIGDMFLDNSLLYRATVSGAEITIANSIRLTPKRYSDVADATARAALTGMIFGDSVYQTDTRQWYIYTTSWIADGLPQLTEADVEAITPRCLGLFAYSDRTSIVGMHENDLVVLYSNTLSERGIYAYIGTTWTKQPSPTPNQVSLCFVYVLDAVRQGYGQSSDYIGTGATSFETLLVNFIYAQYAMITGSIRAGTRYDQSGNEVNPTQEGVWIGANGKIKGAINDVEPDQVTPSFTRRQLFTASGSWTVPAHVKWVRVTAIGGGGGGGGSGGATDNGDESTSVVYNGNNGGAGGASSFGSYITANGGAGGAGSGTAGTGASGQNGGSSDYIGGYNGANGGAGSASAINSATYTGTKTSGAGGARGSSAGLYDANVELSNASGGLTKIPTIYAGASKSNSASSSSGRVVSNGSAGNAGSYGGGGSGASGGCFAVIATGEVDSYSGAGACGGGGGAGALRQRTFRVTEVYGQSITVTVGAGGAGGSAGGGTTALGAAGGKGGDGWVLVEW